MWKSVKYPKDLTLTLDELQRLFPIGTKAILSPDLIGSHGIEKEDVVLNYTKSMNSYLLVTNRYSGLHIHWIVAVWDEIKELV